MTKTTHLLAAAALSLAAVSTAGAEVIAEDSFDVGGPPANYTAGTGLSGQDPPRTGFTGPWLNGGGFNVNADGLTYPGLDSSGGSVSGTQGRNQRLFSDPITAATTGAQYLGFLFKNDNLNTSGYRAVELNTGAGDTTRTLQFGYGAGDFGSPTSIALRLFNNNSFLLPTGVADQAVHLAVIRFDLSAADNGDSATLFFDPSDLSDESANTLVGTLSGFNFAADRLAVASFNGGALSADEFRRGTTFNDVTTVAAAEVIPEPASLAVFGAVGGLVALRRRRRA